jgi:hypothetical protein
MKECNTTFPDMKPLVCLEDLLIQENIIKKLIEALENARSFILRFDEADDDELEIAEYITKTIEKAIE